MKARISRYVEESVLTASGSIRKIIISLNGSNCRIEYLHSGYAACGEFDAAVESGRVLRWEYSFSADRMESFPLSHASILEDELAPLLSRVLTGHSLVWNGKEHLGQFTSDSAQASKDIAEILYQTGGRSLPYRDQVGPHDEIHRQTIKIDQDWKDRILRQAAPPDKRHEPDIPAIGLREKSDAPRVSVIVGVYNKAAYIIECLNSVLRQDIEDIEVICIDDASTDSSADAVESFSAQEKRVRFAKNKHNLGAAATRNRGLSEARGRYLLFLDGDDLLAPNALKRLLERIQNDDVDMVRGGIAFYRPGGSDQFKIADVPPDRQRFRFSDEPHLWIPWWFTTFLFSKSFLMGKGIEFPQLRDGEDPVFLARALTSANSISSISDVVYYYRTHAGQTRNDLAFIEHLKVVKDHFLLHDARIWSDGYGHFVGEHVLPARIRQKGMTEYEEAFYKGIRELGLVINMGNTSQGP